MTEPVRVRFNRYALNIVYTEGEPLRYEHIDKGSMEGIVIAAVVKDVPNVYFTGNGSFPVSGQTEPKTFLVIGCDDGKVEEHSINSVTYITQ